MKYKCYEGVKKIWEGLVGKSPAGKINVLRPQVSRTRAALARHDCRMHTFGLLSQRPVVGARIHPLIDEKMKVVNVNHAIVIEVGRQASSGLKPVIGKDSKVRKIDYAQRPAGPKTAQQFILAALRITRIRLTYRAGKHILPADTSGHH